MGISDAGGLSLGQWIAICRQWTKAHSPNGGVEPPSVEEFEAAVMAARGMNQSM